MKTDRPITHKPCGKVALYAQEQLHVGQVGWSQKLRWPDGRQAVDHEPAFCPHCRGPLGAGLVNCVLGSATENR